MTDVDKALVRAQTLLQEKMPMDPDAHDERFLFFTKAAAKAPFLALDHSETGNQSWTDVKMSVKDALKSLLPSPLMEGILPKLRGIQSIIDGSAKIKGITSFFYTHESGSKHVAQFCIYRIAAWGISNFEVYFVEINAAFDSSAIFGIDFTSTNMNARYCYQKYSTNTTFLMQEMKTDPEQVQKDMEKWDQTVKSVC